MHKISVSSQKIGDIIEVVDSIVFQTSILALNTVVETVRAGEQGRGFTIVAGEVRNLTSHNAQTAKKIKGLVKESVIQMQQGSQLVDMASRATTEIVNSVTRVNGIMGEITSASDKQCRGIEQVAQTANQMDSVMQQSAGLAEEATSAAG